MSDTFDPGRIFFPTPAPPRPVAPAPAGVATGVEIVRAIVENNRKASP